MNPPSEEETTRIEPLIEQIKVGGDNFAYLIGCPETRRAALVDPAFETSRLLACVRDLGLELEHIFVTHGHFDHIGGNSAIRTETGAKVVAHTSARYEVDLSVDHGETVMVGHVPVECLHTPGHLYDSLCFVVAGRAIMTGDTLFVGECGRTDLPGADPRALHHSFFSILVNLPDHLVVYPGHDYGPRPTSTLGEEKRTNYTLEPREVEDFVRFMAEP